MKLLLIDGSNLIFRAYYATEKQNIMTLDEKPANAIHSLIAMIDKLIKDHEPTHMFIALDTGKSTFRHDKYPDYKGKRISIPDALRTQLEMVTDLYEAMGILYDSTEKFEADDLIATYAEKAKCDDCQVVVVSGDKDLLQLVDKNVTVVTPKIGFSNEVRYTPEVFEKKYTFEPKRFIEYKALVGDSSDNIIGVDKVGDKTAKKLLNEYNSLDAIVTGAQDGEIKGKLGERLSESKNLLDENIELVSLITNMDVTYEFKELEFNGFNTQKFINYLKTAGFTKLITKYSKTTVDLEQEDEIVIKSERIFEFNKDLHTDEETFIYTQTLAANYHKSEGLGVALASKKGLYYLDMNQVDDNFINYLLDDSTKITYDLKRLMVMFNLRQVGNFVMDLKLGLAVLNIINAKREFDALVTKYGVNYVKTSEQVYLKKENPVKPSKKSIIVDDISSKALALSDIYIQVLNELEEQDLHNVIYNIEMPLTKVLAKMELDGVKLNVEELNKLKLSYEKQLEEYDQILREYTDINYESPKQLATLLFDVWQLPTNGLKKTKSGYSTNADNLELLLKILIIEENVYQDQINFISKLLEFRKIKKIHSVYLDGLQKQVSEGYLHPIYHQLLVETGRLSVTEPNIQNIPIRSEDGKIIRSLFDAPVDFKVAAIDYSQVELRIIAFLADEKNMINDFENDVDIHTSTAMKILNTDHVTSLERSRAKAINFGIIYGMSSYGLSSQLNISNEEAKEFIRKYFENYPNIEKYMHETIEKVREDKYITTYLGRIRYINGIDSKNRNEREASERIAINTPVQGTAADVIKLAMIKIDEYITTNNLDIKMVMQIHDELVFYVNEKDLELVSKLQEIMENTVNFTVKLKAEANIGDNWLEAK